MLIRLIRRYAALLTLLSAAGAAMAAPYLIPVNPDSAVFRSAVLPALLLLAACFPVRRALESASLRALAYGCVFGFIFALCLGLGSELSVYQKLLPGMGSLVRRLAVPVMVTPMLGALLTYLFCARTDKEFTPGKLPYFAFFLFFALCYGAVLLAFFPGVINYDFVHEITQFASGEYYAAHPVAHTLFLGGLYALGETLFGSMTAGAALYSAVQLLLLAAMYAWACAFLQRRVPLCVTLIAAACFALLPFHGVMAISTAKDPLFAGLCVVLCLLLWAAAEDPQAFGLWHAVRFALCCLGMALLRHNSVFAVLPACLALIVLCRRGMRRALSAAVLAAVLVVLVPAGFERAVGAKETPSSELMSVPCQQLMRTAASDEITQEEREELSAWFSGAVNRYRPHCADPAKGGNFDFARYQQDPGAFLRMYLRYGAKYPRIYLEAFLQNCAGLWNPDDKSHANAMVGESYDYVYLVTSPIYADGDYPIAHRSLLGGLRSLIYNYTHHNAAQKTPVLAQLFCPATYTFALLFASMLLFYRRRRALVLCLTPLWGILFSLFFSAGVFIRYAYPLMSAVPVMLMLALFARRSQPNS